MISDVCKMKKEICRNHDDIYLTEPYNAPIKHSFIQICDLLEKFREDHVIATDIGCAIGVMPAHMADRFPNFTVSGSEYRKDLIEEGKKRFPQLQFQEFDVTSKSSAHPEQFDIITMSGVLQIFDDWQPVLHNLIWWLKPGGRVVVHGLFNPWPVDVLLRYKLSEDDPSEPWETGWNIISKKSVDQFLEGIDAVTHFFEDFDIPIKIAASNEDPLRSWTELDANNNNRIFNGLGLRQEQHFLVIDKVIS